MLSIRWSPCGADAPTMLALRDSVDVFLVFCGVGDAELDIKGDGDVLCDVVLLVTMRLGRKCFF
jgi:hypothetical protein